MKVHFSHILRKVVFVVRFQPGQGPRCTVKEDASLDISENKGTVLSMTHLHVITR